VNVGREISDLLVGVVGVLGHRRLEIREAGTDDGADEITFFIAAHPTRIHQIVRARQVYPMTETAGTQNEGRSTAL
jgi:hypothetical protein